MGQLFDFTCPSCGYRAEVSGGEDCGMLIETQTMVCNACGEVVDVMTGYPFPSPYHTSDECIGRCPRCNSAEVTPWGKDRPCPKCGQKMTKGRLVLLWD